MANAAQRDENGAIIEFDHVGVKIDYRAKFQRFSCQDPETLADGLHHLEQHGYTVISDVLDETEIDTAKNLIWQHLEGLKSPYKIKRGQIHT